MENSLAPPAATPPVAKVTPISDVDRFLQEWDTHYTARNLEGGAAEKAYEAWLGNNIVFRLASEDPHLNTWKDVNKTRALPVKGERCVVAERVDGDRKKRMEQEAIDNKDVKHFTQNSLMVNCMMLLSSVMAGGVESHDQEVYFIDLAFDLNGEAAKKLPADGLYKDDLINFDGYLYCNPMSDFKCAVGVSQFEVKPKSGENAAQGRL